MRTLASLVVLTATLAACNRPNPEFGLDTGTTGTTDAADSGRTTTGAQTQTSTAGSASTVTTDESVSDDATPGTSSAEGTASDPTTSDSASAEGTTGTPPSDCCKAEPAVSGCTDPGIEACVCGYVPECCEIGFHQICAQHSVYACGAECAERPKSCCIAGPSPGCANPDVQGCVCQQRPECCEVGWAPSCVGLAEQCGIACELLECCSAHPSPGCDQPEIVACVCEQDLSCCLGEWHAGCVELATGPCMATCL